MIVVSLDAAQEEISRLAPRPCSDLSDSSYLIATLVAIEEGAEWEVFMTENMTAEGYWRPPGGRSPLWYLKYRFKIRLKNGYPGTDSENNKLTDERP